MTVKEKRKNDNIIIIQEGKKHEIKPIITKQIIKIIIIKSINNTIIN